MTERLSISAPLPTRLVRIEAFRLNEAFARAFEAAVGVAPPAAGRWEQASDGPVLWAEAKAWLVSADAAALADALGEVAAVSDVSGAWRRIEVSGPGWRDLLMVGGVFDAESPAFAPGCVAATLWRHAPVMLQVLAADAVAVHTPPSFAADLCASFETPPVGGSSG